MLSRGRHAATGINALACAMGCVWDSFDAGSANGPSAFVRVTGPRHALPACQHEELTMNTKLMTMAAVAAALLSATRAYHA